MKNDFEKMLQTSEPFILYVFRNKL